MLIPSKYSLTPKISEYLTVVEAARAVIDSVDIPSEVESNLRRKSTLNSSLFSARIEGNTLTSEEIIKVPSKDQRKREVFNILKAKNYLYQRGSSKDLKIKDILYLHKIALEGLVPGDELGHFRDGMEAIYNSAGIAIYIAPRPTLINSLLTKMIAYLDSSKEISLPIRAMLGHYLFEKIHPFVEGNGRVGRLILEATLIKGGYGMKGIASLEEYLDKHRTLYYQALEAVERDVTDYLEFMLEALAITSKEAKDLVLTKRDIQAEDYLLPRRAEILNIIKDQKIVNFDQIRRRFIDINERTLRYDLKKLQDGGLIKKLGTTNGVYYQLTTN